MPLFPWQSSSTTPPARSPVSAYSIVPSNCSSAPLTSAGATVPGSNTIPILPRCATTRASPAYCSALVDPIRLHGAPDTGTLSYPPRRSPHEPTRLPATPLLHRTHHDPPHGGGLPHRRVPTCAGTPTP